MVRVTIELLPQGSEVRKTHLGTVLISNTGAHGAGPVGAYDLLFRVLRSAVGFRNPS